MERLKNVQVGIKIDYTNGEKDDFVLIGSFETFQKYLCDLAEDRQVKSVRFDYKDKINNHIEENTKPCRVYVNEELQKTYDYVGNLLNKKFLYRGYEVEVVGVATFEFSDANVFIVGEDLPKKDFELPRDIETLIPPFELNKDLFVVEGVYKNVNIVKIGDLIPIR